MSLPSALGSNRMIRLLYRSGATTCVSGYTCTVSNPCKCERTGQETLFTNNITTYRLFTVHSGHRAAICSNIRSRVHSYDAWIDIPSTYYHSDRSHPNGLTNPL